MSKRHEVRGTCFIANDGCLAPAGYENAVGYFISEKPARAICFSCHESICSAPDCSRRVRGWNGSRSRVRVCAYCIDDKEKETLSDLFKDDKNVNTLRREIDNLRNDIDRLRRDVDRPIEMLDYAGNSNRKVRTIMKFILVDPDSEADIGSTGITGILTIDNVYLTAYAKYPDGRRPKDLAVGERIKRVAFSLSATRGEYDLVRLS